MTSKLADFEVRAELGEGGSAVVYDAEIDGHRVALKVLREELALSEREKQRFVDEARRMVAVDHPGLVKLERAGVLPDGRPYLAMPFLEGRPLSRRLERGPLPLAEAVKVFGVLARAVDALHAAGIVHRDIKPENILLVDDPAGARPVLLDFGIARDVESAASTTTTAGKIRGTPAYMAPERFFGTPASPRSDVYELGVTFYMMLVGRLPWGSAENVSDRLAPTIPEGLEPAIGRAVARATLRALSTRPELRPASGGELAEEIEHAFERPDAATPDRTTEDFAPIGTAPTVPDVRLLSTRPPPPLEARRFSRLFYAVPLVGVTGILAFGLARTPNTAVEAEPRREPAATTNAVTNPAPPTAAPSPLASVAPSGSAGVEPAKAIGGSPGSATSASATGAPRGRANPGRGSAPASSTRPAANGDPFLEDRK